MTEAEEKKKKLLSDRNECKAKLDKAENLIEGLKSENESWQMLLIKNKESKKSLTGDVLISSGIIAYLGVFTKEYREDCIKSWSEKLKHHSVIITPNFKLENVLGDQVKIAKWRV